MQHLLICDLDGTLADTRVDLTTAMNRTRADFGLPPLSVEEVISYVGDGVRMLIRRSLRGTGVSVDEALPRMKQHYLENLCVETCLYPSVRAGIEHLRRSGVWRLAVFTNKQEEATHRLMESLEIAALFDYVIGAGGRFPLKPAPDAIIHLITESGSCTDRTWIVGDNHTDLESGRHAGIRRAFAAWGFGTVGDEIPDLMPGSFAELVRHLESEVE
jgi:phosphoglycolate phosphatase